MSGGGAVVLPESAAAERLRVRGGPEQIAGILRAEIVRGDIMSGAMLPPVTELMERFAVSRPTLGAAFRILEADGLVTVLPGRNGGPQARLPDLVVASRHIGLYLQVQETSVEDLLEAQAESEPICARYLAKRCSVAGLSELRRCVDDQRAMVAAGIRTGADFAKWVSCVAEFHALLCSNCGNKTLAAQAGALRDVLDAHRRIGIREHTRPGVDLPLDFIDQALGYHDRLTELVSARDGEGAERHWREYLEFVTTEEGRSRDISVTISLFE